MLKLEKIKAIYKNTTSSSGYYIEFLDGRKIHLTKRRTIIALLILIEYGEGSEADIAKGNTKIPLVKSVLGDKLATGIILDYYGDANKPYSELWNEEGFTFIDNLKGRKRGLSQVYTLKKSDHHRLFEVVKKARRKSPSKADKVSIRKRQGSKCNFCGSAIYPKRLIFLKMFAKDRRREVFDHRHPVEKGGDSSIDNFQALCFYCNKCKWQICNICDLNNCDPSCVLRNPETSKIIAPTKENIADVLADRSIFKK